MARLIRCTGCSSHISASEATCPFCDTALHAQDSRLSSWMRLGTRGALVAGALLGVTALAGCPAEEEDNNASDMSATTDMNATDLNLPQPVYGVPADLGSSDMPLEADIPNVQPLYGAIPIEDLGTGEGDMGDMSNNETDQG